MTRIGVVLWVYLMTAVVLLSGCAETRSVVLPNPHCLFFCSATTKQVNTPGLEHEPAKPQPSKEQ